MPTTLHTLLYSSLGSSTTRSVAAISSLSSFPGRIDQIDQIKATVRIHKGKYLPHSYKNLTYTERTLYSYIRTAKCLVAIKLIKCLWFSIQDCYSYYKRLFFRKIFGSIYIISSFCVGSLVKFFWFRHKFWLFLPKHK